METFRGEPTLSGTVTLPPLTHGSTFNVHRVDEGDDGVNLYKVPKDPSLDINAIFQRMTEAMQGLLNHLAKFPGAKIDLPEISKDNYQGLPCVKQRYVEDFVPFGEMSDEKLMNLDLHTKVSIIVLLMYNIEQGVFSHNLLDIFGYLSADKIDLGDVLPPSVEQKLNGFIRGLLTINPRYGTNFGMATKNESKVFTGIDVDMHDRPRNEIARRVLATVFRPFKQVLTSAFRNILEQSVCSCDQQMKIFNGAPGLSGVEGAIAALINGSNEVQKHKFVSLLEKYAQKEAKRHGADVALRNASKKLKETRHYPNFIGYLMSEESVSVPELSNELVAVNEIFKLLDVPALDLSEQVREGAVSMVKHIRGMSWVEKTFSIWFTSRLCDGDKYSLLINEMCRNLDHMIAFKDCNRVPFDGLQFGGYDSDDGTEPTETNEALVA